MTMQTFAILLVTGVAGARLATASVITWMAQAAAGLPFLADGAGGLDPFTGPTAGFLAGFIIAAWLCGWLTEIPKLRGWLPMGVIFLAGYAVILFAGWLRLSWLIGGKAAWSGGVEPFLIGGMLKSALAVVAVKLADRWAKRVFVAD
jgi:biotin transport system substrate-specific component